MPRFVALLRGINVGGHTVKMERLRELFVGLGYADVSSFIASGNVIFEAAEADEALLVAQIEALLQDALGYAVPTFLRTPAELAATAAHAPWPAAEFASPDSALYISFFAAPPPAEMLGRLLALRTPDDDFAVHGRELFWLRRRRISETTIPDAALNRAIGQPSTMRNATTVRKLAAKLAG
jgi:uncharacterized protein (DUF1697 family)